MILSEEAKWYVIHTYSGYEKMVAENIKKAIESNDLKDSIMEARVPTRTITEVRNGKTRTVEQKLFPSYVIVKMILNDETWQIIKKIKGVTGFVGNPHKPNFLTQQEVDKLGIEEKSTDIDYGVGDIVTISSGAFKGFSGKVEAIDKENWKVRVIVSVFDRNTPIDVDLDKVVVI